MIRDLLEDSPDPELIADVCIVGAGAAGIVLAVELARQGKTVTLLEGGGRLVEEESQSPYLGRTDVLNHRGLHEGRVRALGGTTHLWGGQILELDELDFVIRPWVSESGWPFAKAELLPFYRRALALEGLARAVQQDDQVWAKVGEKRPTFIDVEAYVSRWCPEPNFARLHGKLLTQETRVNIWLHANAVALEMEGHAVSHVKCTTLRGNAATFKAREYCFCLGAIESSRFFLQPRAGELPWNESGLLGKHFQDHIDCDAAVIHPRSAARFHEAFDAVFVGGYKYNPKLKLTAAAQEGHGILNAGATFYSAGADGALTSTLKQTAKHMLRGQFSEITVEDTWRLVRHSGIMARQAFRMGVQHRGYHATDAVLKMRVHCEQKPDSASAILLADERDELGMLRTKLSWCIAEQELATIRSFVAVAQSALDPLATLTPHPDLADNSFIACCQDSFHHMGGMRMHPSPRCGIVDPSLRLHHVHNAYVCSSAVFPTSGFSNPTHTLLALAIRLADHLARRI